MDERINDMAARALLMEAALREIKQMAEDAPKTAFSLHIRILCQDGLKGS